ncbi:MFS transporter [Pseudolysinimonas sp.]|uniref:MFS transporter n=1 Tax=Pseudolysinimonas sp. TaxID=2680009 RepID=UPI00286C8F91|nr:MFS transporter [Pseudolysinimonas sp.]
MMVATGLVAIDSTVIATAIPSIVDDLGGFSSFPWLFSVYLLASAVTVPVYAKLADTIGRKPLILWGIGVFLLGSILCGFAWDMPSLIAFRAVQGIGAGAVLPITITMIGDIYTLEERARVQGYLASVWAFAAVAGPTLGGIFAQFDLWRGIFFVNIPLCLLAGWMIWSRFREKVEKRRHRIDVAGAVLLTASMTLLILGVLQGGHGWAWDSVPSLVVFGAGAVLLAGFFVVEGRAAEPILPFWVLSRRLLLTTNLLGFCIGAALIGLTEYVPTFLTVTTGAPPILAGLALGALTIGWPAAAVVAGRVYLRFGFRPTSILGGAVLVLGISGLALSTLAPSIWLVALLCFVIGAGFGFAAIPSLVAAQASVEWNERGVVTGTQMFFRSIGQALGAAALGAIANTVIFAQGGDETVPATMQSAAAAVFTGAALVALLLLIAAIAMPRVATPREAQADPTV